MKPNLGNHLYELILCPIFALNWIIEHPLL